MSIPSELGHIAMPINVLAQGKIQLAKASFEPETSGPRVVYAVTQSVLEGQLAY